MFFLAEASTTGFGSIVNSDNFTGIVIVTIVVAGIVSGCIKSVVKSTSRERSRREIAAYIAEGSMSPEQGERLMKAGGDQA